MPLMPISQVVSAGAPFIVGASVNVGSANTDLAWINGAAPSSLTYVSTGGGSLRSLGVPTAGAGTRYILRNGAVATITLKHQSAGGAGAMLYLRTGADVTFLSGEIIELVYDGANWIEVNIDQAIPAAYTAEIGSATQTSDQATTATTEGAAATICTLAVTVTAIPTLIEFYLPAYNNGNNVSEVVTWLLHDGTSVLGWIHRDTNNAQVNDIRGFFASYRYTPGAGSKTYTVRMFGASGSTITAKAGSGGSGTYMPMLLRASKAS
jgi:hypothetical protein